MNDPDTYKATLAKLKTAGQEIKDTLSDAYVNAQLAYEGAKLATKQGYENIRKGYRYTVDSAKLARKNYETYNSNITIGFEVLSYVPVILTFLGLLTVIFATLVLAADKYKDTNDYEKFMAAILAGSILSLLGFVYIFYNFNSQMQSIRNIGSITTGIGAGE